MKAVACPDESTLVAFLEGRLSGPALADVDAHLGTCAACRDLIAAAAPAVLAEGSRLAAAGATRATVAPAATSPAPELARGATVGRYVILGLVGRGGMGAVYAAYDPELDRKIALKLLNDGGPGSESGERSRGRLLKEAKAIARLSHPNVVVVHDAGTIGDRVFIAMEFVEGQTLAAWLGGKPHPWPEIRAAFLAAGRGLAAAHAARIVHRDFKPQNVMVAADGIVRVMDFGLASDSAGDTDDADPVSPADLDHADFSRTVAVGLTRTGALIGTPAYMAPEQFRGEPADGRTDQFSFCVSLYEALYGERPFAADSLPRLVQAVAAGRLREPPQRVRVPARLRKLLLRGLAVKREDRYASMEELLAALGRDPERQRRRVVVGVGLAAVLLTGGAVGQRALQRSGAALCRDPRERLAGIWELAGSDPRAPHPRRDAVRAALLATAAPHAGDVWERTAAVLDGYATRWSTIHADACQATHVRGEQSAEVLDLRMDCLNRNRHSLRALTDVLSTADAKMIDHAIDAANALPDVARCADVAVLRAVLPPPRDVAARRRVDSVRTRAAEARALGDAGRWKEGLAKALPLRDEAARLGYEPLVAEVESMLAWLHEQLGEAKLAAEEGERALWAAEATRHDEVAAEAAVMLGSSVGYDLAHPDDGERWARFAEAILKRMGPGHERLQGWLAQNRGTMSQRTGDLKRSEEQLRAAIAFKRKADGGDSADVADAMDALAVTMALRAEFAAALDLDDQSLAILSRVYGADSFRAARTRSNRCEALNSLGRHREALDSCRKALPTFEATVGGDHQWVAYPLTAMGIALLGLHRPDDALASLRRAVDIRRRLEPNATERGETWFALARAEWDTGDRAAARAAAAAARDEYAKSPANAAALRTVEAWLPAHGARAAAR